MTAKQKRFVKAELAEQVRLAMPLAKKLVCIDPQDIEAVCNADQQVLVNHITDLLGHDGPNHVTDTGAKQIEKLEQYGAAAYALGVVAAAIMRGALR